MIEIKENINFKLERVMAFMGRLSQEEFSGRIQDIIKRLEMQGVKPRGAFAVGIKEKQPDGKADVEILLPVSAPVDKLDGFHYEEVFEIENAVNVRVSGDFAEFKKDMSRADALIKESGHIPATAKYVVLGSPTPQNPMAALFIADIYFGV